MAIIWFLFLVLLIPQNLYSRYISQRYPTEYVKKVHQLVSVKQTLKKQDTYLDFLSEQKQLSAGLSNQQIIQIAPINKELNAKLQEVTMRSNSLEQEYQNKINSQDKRFQAIQRELFQKKDSANLKLLGTQTT
ncbi:hypothetical protein SAMN02745150_01466 [Brevinema andersonii]|uniref:Uncharacterized protein n=1 Tax=Brevinema andersonii TaxID=34097 RepID=A0A1I1FD25_BREAD|nr:hypothetical protein [Brevinema andersonii]SFB96882.1 hypothetical protein SAMN02745150_01466 [Brevinema andersonii]